jgi:hypothetical protein
MERLGIHVCFLIADACNIFNKQASLGKTLSKEANEMLERKCRYHRQYYVISHDLFYFSLTRHHLVLCAFFSWWFYNL